MVSGRDGGGLETGSVVSWRCIAKNNNNNNQSLWGVGKGPKGPMRNVPPYVEIDNEGRFSRIVRRSFVLKKNFNLTVYVCVGGWVTCSPETKVPITMECALLLGMSNNRKVAAARRVGRAFVCLETSERYFGHSALLHTFRIIFLFWQ